MQLAYALRLGPLPRLAMVGAGGKTTALFHLGRELAEMSRKGYSQQKTGQRKTSTVFLTATTHLATEQLSRADHHFVLETAENLASQETELPDGVILFTGLPAEPGRTMGLGPGPLERILSLAQTWQIPLLVEADGSRQRPLKAPAEHEPVIPFWVDTVLVVAGISALGQPLNPEWVHRPERFAALSGLSPGARITPDAVARVLTSPIGGLKGIPTGARRVVLLNQADTPEQQGQARRLASQLLGVYHAVLVATLNPQTTTYGMPGDSGVLAVHERIAGIILAAGASSRLGQPKQLLPWHGEPLVRHVARTALTSGLSPVVVVTGAHAEQVQGALEGLDLVFVFNPHWKDGQSTSVIAGLEAAAPEVGAAVFLLADQPQVPAELVRSLVELHAETLSPLVAPQVDGCRANPVLFDRQTFPDLMSLTGDIGGRAIFARHQVTWLPWHDPNLSLDVDKPDDYERLLKI